MIVDEKIESPSMEPTRGEASTLNWGKGVAGDYSIRSFVLEISQPDFMFLLEHLNLHFPFADPRQVSIYIESRLRCVNLLHHLMEDAMWLKELVDPLEREKVDSQSNVDLVNDILHCTIQANFVLTQIRRRFLLHEEMVARLKRKYQG